MATHLFYIKLCVLLPIYFIWKVLAWVYPSPFNDHRRHYTAFWVNTCNGWHIIWSLGIWLFVIGAFHAVGSETK